MFQFSNLLSKPGTGANAAGQPSPQSAALEAEEAEQVADTALHQFAERARQDLDEQMHRLAELLDRVESLEFEQEAAANDLFSVPAEQFPLETTPPADADGDTHETGASTAVAGSSRDSFTTDCVAPSESAEGVETVGATATPFADSGRATPLTDLTALDETKSLGEPLPTSVPEEEPGHGDLKDINGPPPSPAPSPVVCQVVLSSGEYSSLSDLPKQQFDESKQPARFTPPNTNPTRQRGHTGRSDALGTKKFQVPLPAHPEPAAPAVGLVHDYRVGFSSGRQPALGPGTWASHARATAPDHVNRSEETAKSGKDVPTAGVIQTFTVGFPHDSSHGGPVGVQVVLMDEAPPAYAAIAASTATLVESSPTYPPTSLHSPATIEKSEVRDQRSEVSNQQSVPARRDNQRSPTPHPSLLTPHHTVSCEIVLGNGVCSRLSDLPEQQDAADRHPRSRPLPPRPSQSVQSGGGEYRKILPKISPEEPAGNSSFFVSPVHHTPGLVQDYDSITDQPSAVAPATKDHPTATGIARRPEFLRRRSFRAASQSHDAASTASGSSADVATDSRNLSLLAIFGGLLTLAALLYIVGDLVSWF